MEKTEHLLSDKEHGWTPKMMDFALIQEKLTNTQSDLDHALAQLRIEKNINKQLLDLLSKERDRVCELQSLFHTQEPIREYI